MAEDVSLASVIVEPKRNTRLVFIKVEHGPDPAQAGVAANAVAQAYVKHNLEPKLGGAQSAPTGWLTEEAARLKAKVQENVGGAAELSRQVGNPGSAGAAAHHGSEDHGLQQGYLDAQAQRMTLESKLRN